MGAYDLKAAQAKREELTGHIRELSAKCDQATGWASEEDRAQWDRLNTEYDTLMGEMEAARQAADVAARMSALEETRERRVGKGVTRPESLRHNAEEDRAVSLQAWMARANGLDITERQAEACSRLGVNPDAPSFTAKLAQISERTNSLHGWDCAAGVSKRSDAIREEYRAQNTGTDSAGGYTVPTGFMAELETAMLDYAGIMNVARILRTASGNDLPWPSIDDTSNTGRLEAENAAVDETALTFGSVTLNAYKRSSDIVLVSQELIEDSAFSLAEIVARALGERLGRGWAAYHATGTGSSQPQGFVTGSTLGVTAASATAITSDEVIELFHSVNPAYRRLRSCGWAMNDTTTKLLRKLKDGNSQYLWAPGLTAAEPDMILGKPKITIQEMAAPTTGNKAIVFGAFEKFIVRIVRDIRFYRLDERYRDNDQTGFVAFMRGDSKVIDAGTHPLKHLIMA